MTAHALPASPAPALHVRHLNVDLSKGFDRYWNGGDAYRSQLFNALSMMFPVGEQFFIDSVRRFAPEVEQQGRAQLLADVKLFIGQEATHRHLHAQYNGHLDRLGYRNWVGGWLERIIDRFASRAPALWNLAATAAYEHWTALLGDGLLRHASWTAEMTPQMRALWRWHAAEESEHKAVAFDVYRAMGGGNVLRIGMFLIVSLEFLVYANLQAAMLLKRDRKLLSPRVWGSALRFWWGREGIVWHAVPHVLRYFKPGFHPWQHDNRALLEQWRTASAGDYRVLGRQAAAADSSSNTEPTSSQEA